MNNEIWKPIKGYEKLYEVSNLGNVRQINGNLLHLTCPCGYVQCYLPIVQKILYVHRMVAEAFIGDIDGYVINHINEDKSDNRAENLEICTQSYNCSYNDKMKRAMQTSKSGKHNTNGYKTIYSIDDNGNAIYYVSTYEAARCTGIGKQNIHNCLRKLYKTAGGLRWFYKIDDEPYAYALF